MKLSFTKLSGAGNDFIIIDNRNRSIQLSSLQIRELCARGTGIGADGLILVEPSTLYDFSMVYHNSDGFLGSMCGNGGRCAAWFAFSIRIPGRRDNSYRFEANGNPYDAWITSHETVKLRMLAPEEFRNDLTIEGFVCHSVNTGSPHVITYVSDLDNVKVNESGRSIRHRTDIFSEGTNVNFIQINSQDSLSIRTFERGVENETLACGTGAVAAALMSYRLGKIGRTTIRVKVRSGDTLQVQFSEKMDEVFLIGPAKIVYEGNIIIP
ncbi:MAG: diaminopimelate epimerase [Chlorobium sp.]|nr:MAG: diaminopimelate epimerase [Chlorobium sp.]